MQSDLGCKIPNNGHLTHWAKQGVLLLNAVLTVQAHQANSHKGQGWETFTDAVIQAVNAKTEPVVFVLWGANARKKISLIDQSRHVVIESAPLAALLLPWLLRQPALLQHQRRPAGKRQKRDRLTD